MSNYHTICTRLKEAILKQTMPKYNVDYEKDCNNEKLKEKVRQHYETWNELTGNNKVYTKIGVCEIGQFTGNELLRVFLDICNNKDYNQPGNYIFLNVNNQSMAVLMFVNCSVMSDEVIPTLNDKQRKMFIKLFNDRRVEKYRKDWSSKNDHWEESSVQFFRDKAKFLYQEFLNTKLSKFNIEEDEDALPIRNAFIALLAKCAYRTSDLDPLRQVQPLCSNDITQSLENFKQIPFAACIQFAFDVNNSGVIATLLGEIPKQNSKVAIVYEKQRRSALETAEALIKS